MAVYQVRLVNPASALDRTITSTRLDEYILDIAEAAGIQLPAQVPPKEPCSACLAKLDSGEVRSSEQKFLRSKLELAILYLCGLPLVAATTKKSSISVILFIFAIIIASHTSTLPLIACLWAGSELQSISHEIRLSIPAFPAMVLTIPALRSSWEKTTAIYSSAPGCRATTIRRYIAFIG